MQQDYRALAQRHMKLSWWYGLLLSYPVAIFYFSSTDPPLGLPFMLIVLPFMVVVFLGMPALLGAFIRQGAMRWAFAEATSRAGLLGRTILVVEGSVLLLLGIYFTGSPLLNDFHQWPFGGVIIAFFGLSLPWLVSSVLVALRLWPGYSPGTTPETAAAQAAAES